MTSFSTTIIRLFKRQILVQIYMFCLFLISGLIVNFVQLLSCIIWPFNKKLYRRVNRFLASCFWSGNDFNNFTKIIIVFILKILLKNYAQSLNTGQVQHAIYT
jgi:hypothetical protein